MSKNVKEKISEFNRLMKELSEDFNLIFKDGKEDKYREELISMLQSLDNAQQIIRRAFNLFLVRNIDDN